MARSDAQLMRILFDGRGDRMRIGRYTDGRDLTYDQSSNQFAVGGTSVTLEQVLQYDSFNQIEWSNDETRTWVLELQVSMGEGVQEAESRPGKLLGFRSRCAWKMKAASIYYALCLLSAIAVITSRLSYVVDTRDSVLNVVVGILIALVMLSPALFLSGFGYRRRLPFFKHRKVLWSAVGFVVFFLFFSAAIGLANSLHSQPYKAALEAARIAEEEQVTTDLDAKAPESPEEEEEVTADLDAKAPEPPEEEEETYELGEMVDSVLIKNFVAACTQIGIDPAEIKRLEQLSDWAGGERYYFVYEGNGMRVYANVDQSINSINIDDLHVFEQGYEPLRIEDYLVYDYVELQVRAERTVKNALSYPDSARFPWLEGPGTARRHNIYIIWGTVSAKNAFGMAEDISYYIEYEKSGETYLTRYFVLDGMKVIGETSVIPDLERKEVLAETTDGEIVLIDGVCGEYGVSKEIDGGTYIWYYVPLGTYTVTSQTNFTKLYLDENQMIRNSDTNGYWECVSVQTLDFAQAGGPQRLSVSEDQHIELTVRSKVTLVPVR